MVSSGHDLPQKSLQIKQDDKFFSRLLSKENSMANSSVRVPYYGGAAGAIPFRWESRPGTPKHTFSESSLPPLTPPPSYNSKAKSMQKQYSKHNLLYTVFPRLAVKKTHVSPLPSSSSSISSSRSCSLSYSLSSSSENQAFDSPTSTLCFGGRHETSNGFRGCFRW